MDNIVMNAANGNHTDMDIAARENADMEEDLYWLWLCNINNIWHTTIKKLLDIYGTPKAVFQAEDSDLRRVTDNINYRGSLYEIIRESRNIDRIYELREYLHRRNIIFISIDNGFYPDKLRVIDNPPYGIYIRGNIENLSAPGVAIVGARKCTEYGRKLAYNIGFELAEHGINVISGMASGIDGSSQWGAIDAGGTTYGVLGCGVDVCYPRENIELYERIRDNGALISDYPIRTRPNSWQFPLRNRIISALADMVLVVEAKEKSGSLITVEYGLEQGKDILAVPGRVGDSLSIGCNRLIQEGAGLVLSAEDVLRHFGIRAQGEDKNSINKNILLEKDLESLYSCVCLFPKSIEQLMKETKRGLTEILRDLIRLQMMGLIEEPSKNYYSKKK